LEKANPFPGCDTISAQEPLVDLVGFNHGNKLPRRLVYVVMGTNHCALRHFCGGIYESEVAPGLKRMKAATEMSHRIRRFTKLADNKKTTRPKRAGNSDKASKTIDFENVFFSVGSDCFFLTSNATARQPNDMNMKIPKSACCNGGPETTAFHPVFISAKPTMT
jgi:hypothetical protein